ncbi:MAG: DUF177 domain-containing protein [Dehalococcoidia bacterium]|nr:MAG: DUF177 domain-containing protein [Dehalococcoidia bacterium]UCG82466.1 MAG: DUF177 domain-containing protein [Dehalococcoidia bacterium]
MKINVAQQLKEPVGSLRHVEINERAETGIAVQGRVQLLRTNRSILVSGKIGTTTKEVCSRCLEEFDLPLTLDIEEEYYVKRDPTTGAMLSVPSESGTFTIDEDNILDLNEAVRQYILLTQPMKPICRENCAGLCSQCGRNLNEQSCDCKPIITDSPWAPLQALRLSDKRSADRERG